MRKRSLGERHLKILDFIHSYIEENRYPPTHREIGIAVNITSTATVIYHLKELQKQGLIEIDHGVSRGLRLTQTSPSTPTLRVPILGIIAAGNPILIPSSDFTSFDAESLIEIPLSLIPRQKNNTDLFALEVQGDSMVDALVGDGDLLVMRPPTDLEKHDFKMLNGQMAAIWLPEREETTLKYLYKEEDGYRLQPANPTLSPIFIDKNETVEIKGKVVTVIRSISRSRTIQVSRKKDYARDEYVVSRIILENSIKPDRSLTLNVLSQEVIPYLKAVETIQSNLDKIENREINNVLRIKSITHYSPENLTLTGVTSAIEFIITRIDPNRRRLIDLQIESAELDNKRKRFDLLSELLDRTDKLTNEQKNQILDAMTHIATSNLRLSRKDKALKIEKKRKK